MILIEKEPGKKKETEEEQKEAKERVMWPKSKRGLIGKMKKGGNKEEEARMGIM